MRSQELEGNPNKWCAWGAYAPHAHHLFDLFSIRLSKNYFRIPSHQESDISVILGMVRMGCNMRDDGSFDRKVNYA